MTVINIPTLYERFFNSNISISDEGGFIETITAFSLLFSGIFLIFQTVNKAEIERKITLLFSLTCIALFFREVDIEDYNVPYFIHFFGQGIGRNILFASLYSIIIIPTVFKFRSSLLSKITHCVKSKVSIIILTASAIILLASLFESHQSEFFEELLEMNAAFLIMLASIIHLTEPIYTEPHTSGQATLSPSPHHNRHSS